MVEFPPAFTQVVEWSIPTEVFFHDYKMRFFKKGVFKFGKSQQRACDVSGVTCNTQANGNFFPSGGLFACLIT